MTRSDENLGTRSASLGARCASIFVAICSEMFSCRANISAAVGS